LRNVVLWGVVAMFAFLPAGLSNPFLSRAEAGPRAQINRQERNRLRKDKRELRHHRRRDERDERQAKYIHKIEGRGKKRLRGLAYYHHHPIKPIKRPVK